MFSDRLDSTTTCLIAVCVCERSRLPYADFCYSSHRTPLQERERADVYKFCLNTPSVVQQLQTKCVCLQYLMKLSAWCNTYDPPELWRCTLGISLKVSLGLFKHKSGLVEFLGFSVHALALGREQEKTCCVVRSERPLMTWFASKLTHVMPTCSMRAGRW